jgi:hypothetical protein
MLNINTLFVKTDSVGNAGCILDLLCNSLNTYGIMLIICLLSNPTKNYVHVLDTGTTVGDILDLIFICTEKT